MDKLKRISKKLLYPNIFILLILFPVSLVIMIWAMLILGESHVITIIGYILSAYALLACCFRVPDIIKLVNRIKNENKYIVRYRTDSHLRIKINLVSTFLFNSAYAILQFFIGLYHNSFWFYSMCAYYLFLAIARFHLMKYTLKFGPNVKPKEELKKYIFSGWLMLLLNIALSVMIFFMVYWNRTFIHHQITTIALAAYTFISFTMSIINFVKYRKYKSPLFNAAKSISLTAATVSIITLEATMLTSFGTDMNPIIRKLFLGITGAVISVFVVSLALMMIVKGTRSYKEKI